MTPSPVTEPSHDLLAKVLSRVSGTADARLYRERWTTLRFANTRLYQPHWEDSAGVSLRVAHEGGRIGVATTTDLTTEGLDRLVRQASALAAQAPPVRSFPGFLSGHRGHSSSSSATPATVPPRLEAKEAELERALARCGILAEPRVAGVYNEGDCELAVANTSGLSSVARRTVAQASFLVEDLARDPPVSGWSEIAHWDPSHVNLDALAAEALERTPREPAHPVEPGTYRVLLRGPAVATILTMLSMGGLGAFAVEEGWSFLTEPNGAPRIAESLTISDDPSDDRGLPSLIDYEGTPHRPRHVFERGEARGPAHDVLTAARAGVSTTGNALPPEAPWSSAGPIPLHLVVEPGTATEDEMLRELGRGIVVTRLHYVRYVHRQKTLITGMTRDGTYWVDHGQIQHPVANLRVTDSMLGLLARTLLVGKDARCYNEDERGVLSPVVPSLLVDGLHFSSATTF